MKESEIYSIVVWFSPERSTTQKLHRLIWGFSQLCIFPGEFLRGREQQKSPGCLPGRWETMVEVGRREGQTGRWWVVRVPGQRVGGLRKGSGRARWGQRGRLEVEIWEIGESKSVVVIVGDPE